MFESLLNVKVTSEFRLMNIPFNSLYIPSSDNTLIATTIPQGAVHESQTENGPEKVQSYTFDFFNYAGIHRSVHLFRTPSVYIEDVILETDVGKKGEGILKYNIVSTTSTAADELTVQVTIFDRNGTKVATGEGVPNAMQSVSVANALLWWPYLMHSDPGYLYSLEVRLSSPAEPNVDVYRMKFGFRTIKWSATQMLINEKPIYFRGFGRHEDSDVRYSFMRFNLQLLLIMCILSCRSVARDWTLLS